MSSHTVYVPAQSIAISRATLGSLPGHFQLPGDSPHQRLPSGLIIMSDAQSAFAHPKCDCLDCLVSGSSPTPLMTLCMAVGVTALYFVFDPLDPCTRAHLECFRQAQVFPFLVCDGERFMPYAAMAPMFDKGLKSTRGRAAPSSSDWERYARGVAGTLPGIYATALKSVARSRDHRVFLVSADEQLHSRACALASVCTIISKTEEPS